jgi:outer membrane lipoprotein carrier protein
VDIGMKDNLPVRVELLDSFGQTTRVDLSGIAANPQLPAKEFQFVAPKGVDVVKM